MQRYEYRVVPAPKKGKKAKGVKTAEGRFATALTDCMNEMAVDGWEYLRTDTLPSEERAGLTGRTTVFQNMLVFRRDAAKPVETDGFGAAPVLVTENEADAVDEAEDKVEPKVTPVVVAAAAATPASHDDVGASGVTTPADAGATTAETEAVSTEETSDEATPKAHAAE